MNRLQLGFCLSKFVVFVGAFVSAALNTTMLMTARTLPVMQSFLGFLNSTSDRETERELYLSGHHPAV